MPSTLEVMSGVITVISFGRFISSIFKGKVVPRKATWVIWSTSNLLTIYGMYLQDTLNVQAVTGAVGAFVVAGLSFRYGNPGWRTFDLGCMVLAVLGMIVPRIVPVSPNWSLGIGLLVTFVALWPTMRDTYRVPEEDDPVAWLLQSTSSICMTLAVSVWDIAHAAQPLTYLGIGLIMVFLCFRKKLIGFIFAPIAAIND